MAKIKISLPDLKVTIKNVQQKDGSAADEEKSVRELETKLLESVFQVAFTTEKALKNSVLARDVFERIQNLTDAETEIELTAEDLQIFGRAWENMTPQNGYVRGGMWMYAKDLLKQLV
jgi:hypothetical protein